MKTQPIGVSLDTPFARGDQQSETAIADLVADGTLASTPGADVALSNGGSLRTDLPAGPLTYGSIYELYPFDNRIVTLRLTGDQLARIIAYNLERTARDCLADRDSGSRLVVAGRHRRSNLADDGRAHGAHRPAPRKEADRQRLSRLSRSASGPRIGDLLCGGDRRRERRNPAHNRALHVRRSTADSCQQQLRLAHARQRWPAIGLSLWIAGDRMYRRRGGRIAVEKAI